MFWAVLSNWIRGEKVCILDTPLLVEGGLYKWMSKVIVVYWCVVLLLLYNPSMLTFYLQLARAPATTAYEA